MFEFVLVSGFSLYATVMINVTYWRRIKKEGIQSNEEIKEDKPIWIPPKP